MNQFIHTNVAVYKTIAEDSYRKMVESIEEGRRSKPDGSPGWIITYDPDQTSFKHAMILIVFTGMWLEAVTYLLIVKKYGKDKFIEFDYKTYEEKLILLGCSAQGLLKSVKRFRETRKPLVHEKANLDDGEIKWAQKETENAHDILIKVGDLINEENG
jgi:hypothetical protein